MSKQRILSLGLAWIGAIVLVMAVAALFQVPAANSQGPTESDIEADKALAAEQQGNIPSQIQVNLNGNMVGNYQLFEGVDDVNIPAIMMDVSDSTYITVFQGVQVWGSAYDAANDIVYFNSGTTLYEWPVGGSPTMLGLIHDPGGANLSMVALGYYNGTLYSTRNIANEAVYSIDLGTLVATPVIDYTDADYDFGGISFDPDTGILYGVNDDATPNGYGLYQIGFNGAITQVTPYPAGQNDIDGLAVGGGKAYMVTDDANGNTFVYNLGGGAYETPLVNPWPTSETFAAGAWIDAPGGSISLTKTVGLDVNACATTTEITVTQGTQVTYCYNVTNTGGITLAYHDLFDSNLGTILDGFFYPLGPGASAFVTDTDNIFFDTTNTATWTACNTGITGPDQGFNCTSTSAVDVVTDTAQATVYVLPPSIDMTKTVGTDPNACATTSNITVTIGTDVTYCYNVTNTGGVVLTVHDLDDDVMGTILSGFPYSLTPGASVFVTQSANITTDTVNIGTWTACNIDGDPSLTCADPAAFDVVTAQSTALVQVTQSPPTDVSLNSFSGRSNNLALPIILAVLALLVFAPFLLIRHLQARE